MNAKGKKLAKKRRNKRKNQKLRVASTKKARNVSVNTKRHESKRERIAEQSIALAAQRAYEAVAAEQSTLDKRRVGSSNILNRSELMAMTKAGQIAHCNEHNIEYKKSWTKDRIADVILGN